MARPSRLDEYRTRRSARTTHDLHSTPARPFVPTACSLRGELPPPAARGGDARPSLQNYWTEPSGLVAAGQDFYLEMRSWSMFKNIAILSFLWESLLFIDTSRSGSTCVHSGYRVAVHAPRHLAQTSGRCLSHMSLAGCRVASTRIRCGGAPPCHLSARTLTGSLDQWRILLRRLPLFTV